MWMLENNSSLEGNMGGASLWKPESPALRVSNAIRSQLLVVTHDGVLEARDGGLPLYVSV